MKKHSVIIDCDTGTDDAVAIIAALGSEELDIRAITTVCGNVDLAYTAANTLNLVRMLGFDTPVARGAERPLLRDITQPVSYTHLDVYKRQAGLWQGECLFCQYLYGR